MVEIKKSSKKYWLTWILILLIIIIIKILFLKGAPTERSFWLIVVYAIFSWLGIGFIRAMKIRELLKYIERNYPDKYTYLTSLFGFDSVRNDFKVIGFIYSKDNLNDPYIHITKSICRKIDLQLLVIFITFPFIAMILFF